MKIKIESPEKLHEAARLFVENKGNGNVFAFYGKMGAGKTTFIKAICEVLGVEDVITSPTFALVNEYTSGDGDPIYHFDFYRLEDEREAEDIGVDDYFESGAVCLIEWPERIDNLLPDHTVRVDIVANDDNSRTITLTFPD